MKEEMKEKILQLSKGNPGAITVLARLDWPAILKLEELHITGSKIWEKYKDVYHEDIKTFNAALLNGSVIE